MGRRWFSPVWNPNVVAQFRHSRYRFLSNFYRCRVKFEGDAYRSVEHAYQAAKTQDRILRRQIAALDSPAAAKRRGNRLALRANWEKIKVGVMLRCLESKFSDPYLARLLIGTHPKVLVEGNDWGDTYWGVDIRTGEGRNLLGILLMIVRESLIQGRTGPETRRVQRERYLQKSSRVKRIERQLAEMRTREEAGEE